jgi:hypothetical protein
MINDVWKDGQMVYYHHQTHPFKVISVVFSADFFAATNGQSSATKT